MAQRKLPKMVFIKWDGDGKDEHWLAPFETEDAACELDEAEIGTYQLVRVRKGKLVPELKGITR